MAYQIHQGEAFLMMILCHLLTQILCLFWDIEFHDWHFLIYKVGLGPLSLPLVL